MELSSVVSLASQQTQATLGAEIAVAIAKTALDAQKAEGQAILQLLDPNAGKNINASA